MRRSGRDESPLRSGDDQAGFNPEWQESKQKERNNHTGKNHSQKKIAVDTFSCVKHFFAADEKPYLLIFFWINWVRRNIKVHNSYWIVCHSMTETRRGSNGSERENFDVQKRTCSHDACGWDRQQVLGAMRRVDWCYDSSLSTSICLCPRCGDGENSCLVVGWRGSREGNTLVLLLFHLVQEHGILYLALERDGFASPQMFFQNNIDFFPHVNADVLFRPTCPGTVEIGDQKYDELKWDSSIISVLT